MQGADHGRPVRYARVNGVAELTFLSQRFKDCLGDRLTGLGLSTRCLQEVHMRDCNGGNEGSDKSDKWGRGEVEELLKT